MKKNAFKFSFRLLLIHFAAICLFIYGFKTFSFFYDFDLVKSFNEENAVLEGIAVERIANFGTVSILSSYGGLLLGCMISFIISLKNKLGWINPLLILISSVVLLRFRFLVFHYLGNVFALPGTLVNSLEIKLIINGSIMILIGCILFFNKKINKYILKEEASNKQISQLPN